MVPVLYPGMTVSSFCLLLMCCYCNRREGRGRGRGRRRSAVIDMWTESKVFVADLS